MIIGLMTIDLHSDQFHSLKEKRAVVQSIKETVKHRFNVAVIESGHQELWQRAQISLVSLALSKPLLETLFRQVEEYILANYSVERVGVEITYP